MATSEGALNYAGVQVGQVEGEEAEESTFTAMTLHSDFHTPWGKEIVSAFFSAQQGYCCLPCLKTIRKNFGDISGLKLHGKLNTTFFPIGALYQWKKANG